MCAVLLIVHATNAEFFVNCVAAPDADPEAVLGCTNLNSMILNLLDDCAGSPMYYVGSHAETPPTRLLRSREEEHRQTMPRQQEEEGQSERELEETHLCDSPNLNPGKQLFCCLSPVNYYSYCVSPSGGRRLTKDNTAADLNGDLLELDEKALEHISNKCSTDFRKLAKEFPQCLGADEKNLFCKSFVVISA